MDGMLHMGNLKGGEFSNPMYEEISHNAANKAKEEASSAIYEVPDTTSFAEKPSQPEQQGNGNNKKSSIGSAVLSLSSIIHRGAASAGFGRQAALDPSMVDTGKDTQQLVEEDKFEC